MLTGWLEAACAALLASPSLHSEVDLAGCRLCKLVQIIGSSSDDGPCLAHVADAHHYVLAVLEDAPIAKLSRRFSLRPLSSFAGALIEVRRGKLKVASRSTANVVLFVEDFVVVGGVVGADESISNRPFIMQAEQVKRAAVLYAKASGGDGGGGGGGADSCDLLALDTLCSQYNTCLDRDDDSSDCLSIGEEDCRIPHDQALAIEAMIEGREGPPVDPANLGLVSSQAESVQKDDGAPPTRQAEGQGALLMDPTHACSPTDNKGCSQPQPVFDDIVGTQQIQDADQDEIDLSSGPEESVLDIIARPENAGRDANVLPPAPAVVLPLKRKSGPVIDYSKWMF